MSDQIEAAEPLQCVGLIGAGMLGVSIAHLTGQAGLDVVLKVRTAPGAVERGQAAVRASFAREVRAGRATSAGAEVGLARICVTSDYTDLSPCEIAIECVSEQFALKRTVLREIEAAIAPGCVLASATSSFGIGALAEGLARPENVVAMHYFWPAHRRPLVEIANHATTAPAALNRARALARRQGLRELLVRGTPGFLTTRLILAYFSEAITLAEQGLPLEDVDQALVAFGWRMGPFHLMDWLGLENLARIHDALSPLMGARVGGTRHLRSLVDAGYLGRRADAGFYVYDAGGKRPNPDARDMIRAEGSGHPEPDEAWRRPMFMILHEAAHCLAEGVVASWAETDLGAEVGLNFPANQGGLLAYLNRVGMANLVRSLLEWEQRYGERFRPSWQGKIPPTTR